MAAVSILIPTWNNYEQLAQCVQSIIRTAGAEGLYDIHIINNGAATSTDFLKVLDHVTVHDTGENLGWEGGLEYGLKHTDSEFVMFLNDDTFFPDSSHFWLHTLLQNFKDPIVGAVGPATNVVMGRQNIWHFATRKVEFSPYLIFYAVLLKRSAVETAGGIDKTLPGGDDLDLSIRLRKAGFGLVIDRRVFVYHHGFQSGVKKHGDYYNSTLMVERTNRALIQKHGLKEWFFTLYGSIEAIPMDTREESDVIAAMVPKGAAVAELGCGYRKTVEHAIGFDMVEKGLPITTLHGDFASVADVTADVSQDMPEYHGQFDVVIARHVLEHTINPIQTISYWKKLLKKGGKLIIAVPDDRITASIPMNIEHKHAYTPEVMQSFARAAGFDSFEYEDTRNGISFIGILK